MSAKAQKDTAVIYERVSSKRQALENNSLATQRQVTREHCDRNGWHVVATFDDPGESGTTIDRPGFQKMLAFCKKNRVKYVVVYDLSRFSRNASDQGHTIHELHKRGTLVRSVHEPNVDETAAGKLAANLIAAQNQYQSNVLGERTEERMRIAFELGRFLRGAPIGYDSVKRAPRGQANIIPNRTEAALVLRAFQLMASGSHNATDALEIMTEQGLRSKRGKRLNLHSFLKMLRNAVYIGMVVSKKWRETRPGLHQAIVDEQTFRNVQLILKGKKPIAAPYTLNRADFPLRRFLRCCECDTPLTGAPCRGKTGNKYGYYWCRECGTVKTTRTEKIDGQFVSLLERLRPTELLMREFPAILKQEWETRTGDNTARVRKLESDLRERTEAQQKLLAKYLNDDPNIVGIFDSMNSRFTEEIAALKSQIAEVKAEKATFDELLAFSKSMLVDIPTAWGRAEINQKQRVQNALFPGGLKYHPEKGILNPENDCLFSQLEDFTSGKMLMARPERFELPAF